MTSFSPAPTEARLVLDTEWLTTALSTAFPGIRVLASTLIEQIVVSATKLRIELEILQSGQRRRIDICIKAMMGELAPMLIANGSSKTEALFYRECAPLLPVRVPPCHYAEIDPENGHGLIIMQDVIASGGKFLSALEPYTPAEASDSLEQLAMLHATTWRGSALFNLPWVGRVLDRFSEKGIVPLDVLQALLDDPRGNPLPAEIRDAHRLQQGLGHLAARVRSQPNCLIHGDAHAGNLYRDQAGVAVVDWQVFQRSSWAQDVAYHIGAVLTPEDRRANERALLENYLEHLAAFGGPRLSITDAWDDYRAAMIYGYYLWGVTRRVEPAIINEFVRRLGLAVVELDSFSVAAH